MSKPAGARVASINHTATPFASTYCPQCVSNPGHKGACWRIPGPGGRGPRPVWMQVGVTARAAKPLSLSAR